MHLDAASAAEDDSVVVDGDLDAPPGGRHPRPALARRRCRSDAAPALGKLRLRGHAPPVVDQVGRVLAGADDALPEGGDAARVSQLR